MPVRELQLDDSAVIETWPDLILRRRPNWAVVIFLASLGMLHLTLWAIALSHGHIEGYMSLAFGSAFCTGAIFAFLSRSEITIVRSERLIRLRTGYRRLCFERIVPFDNIRGVRLTLGHGPDHAGGVFAGSPPSKS